jgi:hypothetical protein
LTTPPWVQVPGFAGPNWLQAVSDVHWLPSRSQVPIGGQFTGSVPGVVHGWLVMLHTPPVGGHWLSFAQAFPLLLHLPALGHPALLKHAVKPSEHKPGVQSVLAAHFLPAGLSQVPAVRH